MIVEITVDRKVIGVEVQKDATDDEKVDALRKVFRAILAELFGEKYSLAIVRVTDHSSGTPRI
jgi:hypothetical protein